MSYCGIGLYHPQNPINIAGVLRACGCYQASFLSIEGAKYKRNSADTNNEINKIPVFHVDLLKNCIPYDCVPVAVDLIEDAESLFDYKHPKNAYYIFGPENGTLGEKVTNWCRDKVYIPMRNCSNLAATVNVVLYDRKQKEYSKNAKI